jgi:hypothetical protein
MSKKGICLVPAATELSDLPGLCCRDDSHTHISNTELTEGRIPKQIEFGWLREPGPHVNGVVRRVREFPFRGLSCQVGGPLALAVHEGNDVYQVQVAEIKRKRLQLA